MHSAQARDFIDILITDLVWPRYRRTIARKVQRIIKLEQRAAEHWICEFVSPIFALYSDSIILCSAAEETGDKNVIALWLKDVAAIKTARMTIRQPEDEEAIQQIDERVTGLQDTIMGKDTAASASK